MYLPVGLLHETTGKISSKSFRAGRNVCFYARPRVVSCKQVGWLQRQLIGLQVVGNMPPYCII